MATKIKTQRQVIRNLAERFFRCNIGDHDFELEGMQLCYISPKRFMSALEFALQQSENEGRRLQSADDDCGTYYDNFEDTGR